SPAPGDREPVDRGRRVTDDEPLSLPSVSGAMDGAFIAITDVSNALAATGAAEDYRLIGGVAVMLHVQRPTPPLPPPPTPVSRLRARGSPTWAAHPGCSGTPLGRATSGPRATPKPRGPDGNEPPTTDAPPPSPPSSPPTPHGPDTPSGSETSSPRKSRGSPWR